MLRFSLSNLMLAVLPLSLALGGAKWAASQNSGILSVLCLIVGIPTAIGALVGGRERMAGGFWVGAMMACVFLPFAAAFLDAIR
jgi:hypothetical protein